LEGDPDLLDLERLLVGDQPNPGPAIRLASDQAFLVEPDQGGANAGSTGPEQAGKVCLDQPLVGLEPAADDRVSELPVDPDASVQRLNRGKGPSGCPPGRSVSNTGFHGSLSNRLCIILSTIRRAHPRPGGEEKCIQAP